MRRAVRPGASRCTHASLGGAGRNHLGVAAAADQPRLAAPGRRRGRPGSRGWPAAAAQKTIDEAADRPTAIGAAAANSRPGRPRRTASASAWSSAPEASAASCRSRAVG